LKIAVTCEKNSIPINYIKWIKQAGFEPVIIDRFFRINRLEKCSGIIFTGGGDIKYWFYSSTKTGNGNNALRDVFEFFLFSKAKHMPVLAICRGAQIINIFMGGTLKDLNNAHMHIGENDVFHPLFTCKRSFLVNSKHHQAIDKLAPSFEVVGYYGDCIELAVNHNIILCQFHPERLNDRIILNNFKYTLMRCKK